MVVTYLKYIRYVYLKYQKGFLASLAYFGIKKEQCNFLKSHYPPIYLSWKSDLNRRPLHYE